MADDNTVLSVELEGHEDVKKGLKEIGVVGVEAFTQILEAASHGDFAGVIGMAFGKIAETAYKAGEVILEFAEKETKLIETTAALGNAFGASLEEMAGMREAFAAGGISAQGFERLVQRMAMTVGRSWQHIQQEIRTSADTQQSAFLGVAGAAQAVERAYSRIETAAAHSAQAASHDILNEKEAFLSLAEAQERASHIDTPGGGPDVGKEILEDQRNQLAVAKAMQAIGDQNQARAERMRHEREEEIEQEHALKKAKLEKSEAAEKADQAQLRDIPTIKTALESLKDGGGAVATGIDVARVSTDKLKQAFMAMGDGSPLKTMSAMMDTFAKDTEHAISKQERLALVQQMGGGMRGSGGGADAAKMVEVMEHGSEAFKKFQEDAEKAGMVLNETDVKAAEALTKAFAQLEGHLSMAAQKFAAFISPAVTAFLEALDAGLLAVVHGLETLFTWLGKVITAFAEMNGLKSPSASDNKPAPSGHWRGGPIKGPGGPTSDLIPAYLSNGEFVVRADGGNLMDALNHFGANVGRFATGGLVASGLRAASASGKTSANSALHVHLDGKEYGPFHGPADVVDALASASVSRQTAETGRKPSWLR